MKLWKDLRVNFMYWRFRNITRNRLRLQSWWYRRRQPSSTYRPRGAATFVYRHSARRTWLALLVMIALLTLLGEAGKHYPINPTLSYALSAFIIIAAVYWALKGL